MIHNIVIIPALPEIVLAICAMASMVIGVMAKKNAEKIVYNSTIIFLLFTLFCVIQGRVGAPVEALNGLFISTLITQYIKIVLIIGTLITFVMARKWLIRHNINRFEYASLQLFALLGMMVMVSANNLLVLYVGLELRSLALYVLASFYRDNARSTEAGIKYFVLGSLASGLFLYGVSLLYGFTGTLDYDLLREANSSLGSIVGLIFVIVALLFKISAAPFHMWAPDVYEGAPSPVVAFFAVVPKIAAIIVLAGLLLHVFQHYANYWVLLIEIVAAISLIVGAFAALVQTNIKRLMAYSSIGHIGFILAMIASNNDMSFEAILLYVSLYSLMMIGVFAVILSLRKEGAVDGEYTESLDDLKGIARSNPKIAFVLLLLFSMAAIPPLGGFFAKFYAFMAMLESQMYVLAVIAVICSVVSAFYYIRIICYMYFSEHTHAIAPVNSRSLVLAMAVTSIALTIGVVFIGYLISYMGYITTIL